MPVTASHPFYFHGFVNYMMRSLKFTVWLVCMAASLFPFFSFFQMNILNVISKNLLEELAINKTQLGSLSAIYLYANAALLIPAGLLLDRFSTLKILLSGFFITIIGTVIFAFSNTIFLAQIGRFITGCGHTFALLCCFRLIADLLPMNRQAFAASIVITVAMMGGVMAQTPLALLIEFIGWRGAILVSAFLGILIAVFLGILLYLCKEKEIKTYQKNAFLQGLKCAFLNKQNWFCGLYISLLALPLIILGGVWGIYYLTTVHNLSEIQASFITSMLFIGTIFGAPLAGITADFFANKKVVMFIGSIGTLFSFLLILYVPDLSVLKLNILFLMLGLFASAQVIGYPAIIQNNEETYSSTAMAFANILVVGGAGTAQIIFGTLLQGSYSTAMYFLITAFIVAIFMNFFIKTKD